MANKISKIDVLEEALRKQHIQTDDGAKVEIGRFWSVLQIYLCTQRVNVSVATLCAVASLMNGRLDSKYRPTTAAINPAMIRKYLKLEASPSQVGHTVVTKKVSSGINAQTTGKIKETLLKYNSYGEQIAQEIAEIIEEQKGEHLESKFSVMGNSDFCAVLELSLALLNLKRMGLLDDLPPRDHVSYIIKTINENKDKDDDFRELGERLSSTM